MEHNIGVGAIVGLATASSFYIYNSKKLNSVQKTILLICVLFPPAQWLGILIVVAYNKNKENNSVEKIIEREIELKSSNLNLQVESLKDLREKEILTEEEYNQKISKIENEKNEENLKNSQDYKQLKSLFENGILTKDEFEAKVIILTNIEEEKRTNEFRIIDGFSEGLALVINSDLDYGYINESGKVIINFKFEHAENFINGVAKVRYNGKFKNINKKGEFL
jgi:hypothetical protein